MKKVNFLGFEINQCGLKLQSEKISKIVDFKSPENANARKSFLGVIVFLRKFINEFAILTTPLYDLLSKIKRFMWDDLCGNNFRKLKQKVIETDTLFLPNFSKPFIIFCDASDKAIGFFKRKIRNCGQFFMVAGHDLILNIGIVQLIKNCC